MRMQLNEASTITNATCPTGSGEARLGDAVHLLAGACAIHLCHLAALLALFALCKQKT